MMTHIHFLLVDGYRTISINVMLRNFMLG